MLKRHRSAVLILILLALTACSDPDEDAPPPIAAVSAPAAGPSAPAGSPEAGSPAAPAPASPTRTATATGRPEIVTNPDGTINSGGPRPPTSDAALTAGGFGPYKIGVTQRELAAANLLGKVTTVKSGNCVGYATAKGVAKYRAPQLTFYDGRLLRLTVTSAKVRTDKGVTVGTAMGEVRKQYPDGKQIDDWTGRGAWLATVGDFGLLFDLRDDRVAALQAGMTGPMQFKYTDNQGC